MTLNWTWRRRRRNIARERLWCVQCNQADIRLRPTFLFCFLFYFFKGRRLYKTLGTILYLIVALYYTQHFLNNIADTCVWAPKRRRLHQGMRRIKFVVFVILFFLWVFLGVFYSARAWASIGFVLFCFVFRFGRKLKKRNTENYK